MREAVITGVGPVSALGNGREVFWTRLLAGESGTSALTRPDGDTRLCCVAAQVADPPRRPLQADKPAGRAMELGREAGRLAWLDAGLAEAKVDRARVGIAFGTGMGNLDAIEFAIRRIVAGEPLARHTAFLAFAHITALALVEVAGGAEGPMTTVTTGCNSGLDAIAVALDWIRLGKADIVVAGGVEAELVPFPFAAMEAGRAFTNRHNDRPGEASRPFDLDRGGNVPGEGAGVVIIEEAEHARQRGAKTIARLASAVSLSAGTRPPYEAKAAPNDVEPLVRCMRAALAEAQIALGDLSAISANGSSSIAYDAIEAAAYRELLGPMALQVPVYSIKGALGQTGGGTPVFQVMAAALGLAEGVIPPTINHVRPMEGLALDIVTQVRRKHLSSMLVHSIGFGGAYHSSAVLSAV